MSYPKDFFIYSGNEHTYQLSYDNICYKRYLFDQKINMTVNTIQVYLSGYLR